MAATKYTLEECPEDILLQWCANRGVIQTPDDFDPTNEEIRAHDTDPSPLDKFYSNQALNAEIKRRGLKGRKVRPW